MITILHHKLNVILFAKLLLVTLFATSCSESTEQESAKVEQVVEVSTNEHSYESGSGKITYKAAVGSSWSAEITEGDDFVSFSISGETTYISGETTSSGNNILYFYLKSNSFGYDRQATIQFTFENEEPIELTVTQCSKESEYSPYNAANEPRWSEIPVKVSSEEYLYVSHNTTLSNGDIVRNYSLCFDINNRSAVWVAYPYHSIYDGDEDRTDDWGYDPKVAVSFQPNLMGSYSGSYDRGHHLPSADRLATEEMNSQTFYFTNMSPQLSSLNQGKWAVLESTVRKQVCPDTLFVVTGADFRSSIGTTTDSEGVKCTLPGAYFKVLLRTRSGYSGKSVSECSASELQAIGFWAEHRAYSSSIEPVSVKEIEDLTGLTFFPSIPEEVKESYASSY